MDIGDRHPAPSVPQYRMYVDEVGNPNGSRMDRVNDRFFSVTGVIVERAYADLVLRQDFEVLKYKYIPHHCEETPVVLHSYEIRRRLKDFNCLSDQVEDGMFEAELVKAVIKAPFTAITCMVDRQAHHGQYHYPDEAYPLMLKFLVERYTLHLEELQCMGDILIESRSKSDQILKKVFPGILDAGYVKPQWLSSNHLKFSDKRKNLAGLQLADLIANASAQNLLAASMDGLKVDRFSRCLIDDLLATKYRRKYGRISGYGTKKFP